MAEERLEIILEADVAKASADIDKFSSNLSKTLPAATAKAAAGIDKMGKSAGNAFPALTNFGRVVQDAPFGLIGIANNIDPLISSFQALQKSTGSTGGALKALGGALLGPAGIGIAISAVTSALIAFGPQIKAFILGTEEATEEQKKFGEELDKAKAGAIKTGVELQTLISIVKDSSTTDSVKNNALKELNKTTKQYGFEVTAATVANGEAATAVDKLTNALIAQAVAAKLADKIADLKVSEAKAIEEVATATQRQATAQANLISQNRTVAQQEKGIGEIYATEVVKTKNQAAAATANLSSIQTELARVTGLVKQATEEGLVVSRETVKTEKQKADAFKGEEIEITKVTRATQGLISANQSLLDLSRLSAAEAQKNEAKSLAEKLKSIQGTGETPISTEGKGPSVGVIQSMIPTDEQIAQLTAFQQAFTTLKANAQEIVESGFGMLIDNVFSTLENGGNIFENLAQGVKGFVLELTKAVIKAIALQAIMKALGFATGGAGNVAGILGGIFGAKAGGGPVVAGGGYIVGESGPEKFYPSQPGTIVPNDMSGMGGNQFEFIISGNTLRAINRRANTSFGRLSG